MWLKIYDISYIATKDHIAIHRIVLKLQQEGNLQNAELESSLNDNIIVLQEAILQCITGC